MKITELKLNNFRNLKKINSIVWDSKINILIGQNAQGKSNLLEAIYYLSNGKSFRTNIDSDLIKWNENYSLVKALIKNKHYQFKIECRLSNSYNKEFYLNGSKALKTIDATQYFATVLFSPEDLMLVKGGPSERRKFLDEEISQISPSYANHLKDFKRVLLQRNNCLKNNIFDAKLEVWTEQLVQIGSHILYKRIEVTEKLKPLSRLINRKLTQGEENLEIDYSSTIKNIDKSKSVEVIKSEFYKQLSLKSKEEKIKKITSVGPQRDDLSLKINGMDIRSFGSQGQQRTASLALKLAEIEFIKSEIGEYPVLLLDDVFSELDIDRKRFLLETVADKIQTFITGTDITGLNKDLIKNAKIFNVKNGIININ